MKIKFKAETMHISKYIIYLIYYPLKNYFTIFGGLPMIIIYCMADMWTLLNID